MADTAISRFACQPEMLHELGQHTANKRTLYDLCLVSKVFHTEFAPCLYSEVVLDDHNANTFVYNWSKIDKNPYWRYTKTFKYKVTTNFLASPDHAPDVLRGIITTFNDIAVTILTKAPQMTHFSWFDAPLYVSTSRTLQQYCPKLQSFTVLNPENLRGYFLSPGAPYPRPLPELKCTQNLAPFANLKRLEVLEIYSDFAEQRHNIVSMLLYSPELEVLSLSLSKNEIMRMFSGSTMGDYQHFFYDMCKDFGEKTLERAVSPLRLRKLSLGLCVLLYQPQVRYPSSQTPGNGFADCRYPAHYLTKLTDLEYLEEVHIHNEWVDDGLDPEWIGEQNAAFAWQTFCPGFCPNLRRLSINRLDEAPAQFLRDLEEPRILTELVVNSMGNLTFELAVELFEEKTGTYNDTRDGEMRLSKLGRISRTPNMLAIEQQFPFGETTRLWKELMRCTGLRKLNVCTFLWSDTAIDRHQRRQILMTISKLGNLSELCLRSEAPYEGDARQLNLAFALQLAAVGKSLRYIKIGEYAWRVQRDGPVVEKVDELDRWETEGIELFGLFENGS